MLAPGFHTSAETPRLTRAAYGAQRFMECVPALLLVVAVVVPVTLLFISPVLAYVAFGGYLFFWGCRPFISPSARPVSTGSSAVTRSSTGTSGCAT